MLYCCFLFVKCVVVRNSRVSTRANAEFLPRSIIKHTSARTCINFTTIIILFYITVSYRNHNLRYLISQFLFYSTSYRKLQQPLFRHTSTMLSSTSRLVSNVFHITFTLLRYCNMTVFGSIIVCVLTQTQ